MRDAILILNAGSSSLKFSIFRDADPPRLSFHGQLEELATQPRFWVRDSAGNVIGNRTWGPGVALSHEEAIGFLFDWGRTGALRQFPIGAVGEPARACGGWYSI